MHRILWPMVGVQFIMSSALTVMSPFLPLYLIQLGVHPIARVDVWSGLLSSCSPLIAAFTSPIWGSMADRFGRKAMVLRSSIAISIFTLLMGLSQNVWELFILRTAMGMFSGFSASAIALVATQVEDKRLGYALGWLSTGQLVGSLIGPLFGGAFADWIGNYRFVFFWTSVISAIAVFIIACIVKENPNKSLQNSRQSKGPIWKQLGQLRSIQGLGAMFVVLLLAQFATRAVQPVVTLFVRDMVGNTAYLATLAGFAFSVTGIGDLIASPFLGKRSDRIGYKRVLTISLLGAALMNIPQAFVHNIWAFLLARFVMGMFMGGILPTANALIGRLAPADQRGRVYGITASATFLGSFFGPMTGGLVSAAFGISVMFIVTAALLVLNWIWVQFAIKEVGED